MAKRHLRASFALLVALGLSTVGLVSQELACGTTAATREATALYLGVSSDMVVTDDFDSVGLFVSVKGEVKFSSVNGVKPGGTVALPGSLSILQPDDPATPVHIRVAGYKDGQVIAVRDAISTVPPNRISVLRLPIQWLSGGPKIAGKQRTDTGTQQTGARVELRADPIGFEPNFPEFARFFDGLRVPCPTGQTSINGTCGPLDVTNLLVPSTNASHVSEVFGGATGVDDKGVPAGGSCFPVADCFADAQTISMADLGADCSVPKTAIPTDQVNFGIRRTKSPGIPSTIPVDFVVDPALSTAPGWYEKGGRYMLPKAICDKEGRRDAVEAILVSTSCKNKLAANPTCGPWSSVNAKMQRPPPAGPYFGSGTDAGLDSGTDDGWAEVQFQTVDPGIVDRPIGLALTTNRAWVVGRDGHAAGYTLSSTDLDPLTISSFMPVPNPAYPPRIVAQDDVVALAVPKMGGMFTDFVRFKETGQVTKITSPGGDYAAVAIVGAVGDPIIAFFDGSVVTLKVYKSTADAGEPYTISTLNSYPVDMSSSGQSRTLYITSGVGLFSVDAPNVGTPATVPLPKESVGLAPPGYNQGSAIYGVFASTATDVYWGKALHPEAGSATEFAILRTRVAANPTNSQTKPWVTGLPVSALDLHDVPAIVGDGDQIFFTDGRNVYGRRATEMETARAPKPIYSADTGDRVLGLAFRSSTGASASTLYAVTERGKLLRGPVKLP